MFYCAETVGGGEMSERKMSAIRFYYIYLKILTMHRPDHFIYKHLKLYWHHVPPPVLMIPTKKKSTLS